MTLEEILEKLHSPTEHAITLENGELTALLEELKELREENKVLMQECDRLIKEKGELLSKVSGSDVLRIRQLEKHFVKAKRLLEVAVEDFEAIGEVHAAPTPMISPKYRDYMRAIDIRTRKWRYTGEALKLIES